MRLLEEVAAVGGAYPGFLDRALANELERDFGADGADAPDAAPEVGEGRRLLAGAFEDHVADFYAGTLGGSAGREPGDREVLPGLGCVESDPRTRRFRWASELQHVVEDRREEIDRHVH